METSCHFYMAGDEPGSSTFDSLLLYLPWLKARRQVKRALAGCGKTHVLYHGTTLQAAEKLWFLKGTVFRPYINA